MQRLQLVTPERAMQQIIAPLSPESSQPFSQACDKCQDGWLCIPGEGVKQCECLRQKILDRALDKIPLKYKSLRLDTIMPLPDKHKDQASVIAALRANPEASLALFGKVGAGKSLFGWLLYRRAVELGQAAVGIPLAELLAEYRDWEKDADKLPSIKPEDLRQSKRRYLVFIDEIGSARPSEYAGEMLFRLIDAAYSFNHQLIVTTNKTKDQLTQYWSRSGESYGPAILRRILEMDNGFEVPLF